MSEPVLRTWSYHVPTRIVQAPLESLGSHIGRGNQALLVTSRSFTRRGIRERLTEILPDRMLIVVDDVEPNPDIQYIQATANGLAGSDIDHVIALGGGSVLDSAKILALLLAKSPAHALETLLNSAHPGDAARTRLPLTAVPTTSGTGAEVTPFATVWDRQRKRKHSLGMSALYPDMAFLDPALTTTLDGETTLYPALDTISHALESLWNRNRTPITEALAVKSLTLANAALPRLLGGDGQLPERSQMQCASLLAGMAISHTRTAVAHAVSYPLTAHFGVPHGLACSFTLPTLLRLNLDRLCSSTSARVLLAEVANLLESLQLNLRLGAYAEPGALYELIDEMHTPGRSDNYVGEDFGGLESLVAKSIKTASSPPGIAR